MENKSLPWHESLGELSIIADRRSQGETRYFPKFAYMSDRLYSTSFQISNNLYHWAHVLGIIKPLWITHALIESYPFSP